MINEDRMPIIILRLEAAALTGLLLWAYAATGYSWWLFVLLLLVPDLSMLGYLAGSRVGALTYNMAHTYAGPIALAVIAHFAVPGFLLGIALIWAAHIAIDRMLGYGLKSATGFGDTHLGRLGRAADSQ